MIETYAYGASKDLLSEKEKIKYSNITKWYKKWLTLILQKKIQKNNSNWGQISDHPYKRLIIGGSVSGKTNSLFNLLSQQANIDKTYLYAQDPYQAKYKFLINKWESTGSKHLNDSKAFIKYPKNMDNICKNIDEYNPNKKLKILIFLMIWFLIWLVIKNLI